mgnify:CR=1 FL=1
MGRACRRVEGIVQGSFVRSRSRSFRRSLAGGRGQTAAPTYDSELAPARTYTMGSA